MFSRRRMWTLISAVLVAAAVLALRPALGRGDDFGERRLDGSWMLTVTVTSPQGIPPFDVLMTFSPGGGVVSSRTPYLIGFPVGPLLETAAHGDWARRRDGFLVTVVSLLQGAPGNALLGGALFAREKIRWRATLDERTGALVGPWQSTFTDAAGNVIFAPGGTITATRVVAEPLQ